MSYNTPSIIDSDPARAVMKWMANMPDAGQSLGVSRGWLVHQVRSLVITADELDTIYALRKSYKASLPKLCRLLRKGYTIEDAEVFYRVRDEMATSCGQAVSLELLGRVIRIFPECDPTNDGLSEQLAEAHWAICEMFDWMQNRPDSSLRWLCDLAEYHKIIHLETALDFLRGRCRKFAGQYDHNTD